MPIQFPSNPTLNQTYVYNGTTWTWSGTLWTKAGTGGSSGGGGGASVTVSNAAPSSPTTGALWVDEEYGDLNVYFSNAWVVIGSGGGSPSQPTITSITGTIKSGYSSTLVIYGNYFGLSAVTVRFAFSVTADVTVTPTSATQISVTVPGAIYNLAADSVGNVSVIDSYGRQSNGFSMSVQMVYDGTTAQRAALSPYALKQSLGTTPTAGVYWFKNSGYNSGAAFQAYADWSIASDYGVMVLCGYLIADAGIASFTDFGTASTTSSGTIGFQTTHRLPAYNILTNWANNSRNVCYLGMTSQTGGTNINTATSKQWIEMAVSLTTLADMFNDAPTTGQFNIAAGITNSSTNNTGRIYWTTSHGNGIYQMSNSSGDSVNSSLWFETRTSGSDTNHTPVVWAAGNGAYYGSNAPFTSRWMFIAISPNNI